MSAIQELFKKYIGHNVTPAEKQLVDAWYDHYDDTIEEPGPDIRDSIWQKLVQQLDLPVETTVTTIPAPRLRFRRFIRYAAAACLTGLLITAAVTIFQQLKHSPAKPQLAQVSTGRSQRKWIKLPDGTTIRLDPASSLRFSESFDAPVREVFMQGGEAWYDIAQDQSRPFLIHTDKLTVKVLGTSFLLRSIAGVGEQSIIVKKGKVAIEVQNKVLGVLTAGKALVCNDNGQFRISDHKDKMAEQMERGWLVLDNMPFAAVQAILLSRYNVHILDPHHRLSRAYFTASFRPSAPLTEVMEVLCSVHHVKFTHSGSDIMLE